MQSLMPAEPLVLNRYYTSEAKAQDSFIPKRTLVFYYSQTMTSTEKKYIKKLTRKKT